MACAGETGCRVQAGREVLQTPTDDARRQRPLLIWPPTLCVGGPVIIAAIHVSCSIYFILLHMWGRATMLHSVRITKMLMGGRIRERSERNFFPAQWGPEKLKVNIVWL